MSRPAFRDFCNSICHQQTSAGGLLLIASRSVPRISRGEALVTNARLFPTANSELLEHKDAIGAAARFCISYFGIKPLVFGHRLVRIQADLGITAPHCFRFSEDEEPAAETFTLALGVDGDVLQKQMGL